MNTTPSNSEPRFDPARAAALRNETLAGFHRKQLKFARYRMLSFLGTAFLALLNLYGLVRADDPEMAFANIAGFALMLGMGSYVDIRYFIARSQLYVQRDLTLLRNDLAPRTPGADLRALAQGAEPVSERVMSTPEYVLWTIACLAVGGVIGFLLLQVGPSSFGQEQVSPSSFNRKHVEVTPANTWSVYVAADGSTSAVNDFRYRAAGYITIRTGKLSMDRSGLRTVDKPVLIDELDRPVRLGKVSTNDAEPFWALDLPALHYPTPNGKMRATWKVQPEREGDAWILRKDLDCADQPGTYSDSVELPAGAEVIEALPAPSFRTNLEDGVRLYWSREATAKQPRIHYTVKYRLPSAAGATKPETSAP